MIKCLVNILLHLLVAKQSTYLCLCLCVLQGWSTCIDIVYLYLWEWVAGGERETERESVCVCECGYASLPSGSHAEMKDSYTQVEVACQRMGCVCVYAFCTRVEVVPSGVE